MKNPFENLYSTFMSADMAFITSPSDLSETLEVESLSDMAFITSPSDLSLTLEVESLSEDQEDEFCAIVSKGAKSWSFVL